jgi:hypothetical protein
MKTIVTTLVLIVLIAGAFAGCIVAPVYPDYSYGYGYDRYPYAYPGYGYRYRYGYYGYGRYRSQAP